MCFYIGVDINRSKHIKLKNVSKKIDEIPVNLNKPMVSGFDYPLWTVLKPLDAGNDFNIEKMHWEFIPSYIRTMESLLHFRKGGVNPKTGKKDFPHNTLNAIGEEVLNKPTYKEAALKRRCLVLASGFYEWRHYTPPGGKDTAYPYYVELVGQEYFFMAGIYNPWIDEQSGEMVDSFSILTTKANSLMEQVHNNKKRMPVILPEDEAAEWIQADLPIEKISSIARYSIHSSMLNATSIIKNFRQSAEPREPFHYIELPDLVLDSKP
jgi:putative SOS response-associated peptidase YedK